MTIPNIRHLLAAHEVARSGSITHAAKRVHLSQSAVTQAVSRLENRLGTTLFLRTAAGLVVSDAGQLFLNRIDRGYAWLQAMEQMVGKRSGREGHHVARLFTVSQLRALIAVVRSESHTRAAVQLGISQPSVHRAIRELEVLCQQRFFQRSPRGVVPSWQARQLARYASLFFAEITQGLEEIDEFRGLTQGSILIGALPLSRTRLVPRAVHRLLEEHPRTRVRIVDGPYEEQLHALLHGELDVIVGALRHPGPSSEIEQELLFRDELNIVVRPQHPLARSREVTVEELRRLNWIAPRENTPAREAFTDFFLRQGAEPPDDVIECSSLVAIRGLLLESERAALLPARQVEIEVEAGLLAVSPRLLAGTTRDIGLTLRRGWQATRLQNRFLELLRQCSV